MNVQLYNALDKAYKFLHKDEKVFCAGIDECERKIERLEKSIDYEPKYVANNMESCGTLFLLFLLFSPAVIIYFIVYFIRESICEAKFNREVRSKFDKEKHQREVKQEIEEEKQKLAMLEKQRNEHYSNNGDCLYIFTQQELNSTSVIDLKNLAVSLRDIIKRERAFTMQEAKECHRRDCCELYEALERQEERARQERYHKETQEKLNRIARENRRIGDELDRLSHIDRNGYRTF